MPRGRGISTPVEAKNDSLREILKALQGSEGKKFSELKDETGFHQSTLSARLKDLITLGYVEHDPIRRIYYISQRGRDDYETRKLIEIIENSSMLILGGASGGSAYPDEDLIIKTSMAYAYPAINVNSLSYLRQVIHKYFMLHTIHSLARRRLIDARYLTGEKPLAELVDQLRANLGDGKQVLAFTLDIEKVSEILSLDYLKEVVRLADVEDMHRVQSTHGEPPRYSSSWRKYAVQERALGFIEKNGKTSLSQLSKIMEVNMAEAESILEELTLHDPGQAEMMIFDEAGKHIRNVKLGIDEEIKINRGTVIKIRTQPAGTRPLIKSSDDEDIYYEIFDNKGARHSSKIH